MWHAYSARARCLPSVRREDYPRSSLSSAPACSSGRGAAAGASPPAPASCPAPFARPGHLGAAPSARPGLLGAADSACPPAPGQPSPRASCPGAGSAADRASARPRAGGA